MEGTQGHVYECDGKRNVIDNYTISTKKGMKRQTKGGYYLCIYISFWSGGEEALSTIVGNGLIAC